jgi:hypothetical protein
MRLLILPHCIFPSAEACQCYDYGRVAEFPASEEIVPPSVRPVFALNMLSIDDEALVGIRHEGIPIDISIEELDDLSRTIVRLTPNAPLASGTYVVGDGRRLWSEERGLYTGEYTFVVDDAMTPAEPSRPTTSFGDTVGHREECGGDYYVPVTIDGDGSYYEAHIVDANGHEATSWYFPGFENFIGLHGCDAAGLSLEEAAGSLEVKVRGVAADGSVGEWSEPVTAEIPACGCSSTSSTFGWAPLLLVAFATRRR